VSRYATTPLIVALSPGHSDHSDITRFRPWSPIAIATGNLLNRNEKIPYLLKRLAPLTFLIRIQAFRDPLHGELPHFQIFRNDGPISLTWDCSATDLAEIRRSSKISSWIWLINSGVVTVLGRPVRDESQVEKSPCINWATQFLTVAYDGACSHKVSFRMA